MIWLTWRQFRAPAVTLYALLVLLAAALAGTAPKLAQDYRTQGGSFLNNISGGDTALYVIGILALLAVPALIGMFWGAPLITRELDAGTYRLAWTLVPRRRWLTVKLAVIGLAAMAAAGLLSLVVSWWASPIDSAIAARDGRPGAGIFLFSRLETIVFDARGVVPVGYAAFAFVLGVVLGVLVRRTLPAMALLLASFVAVQAVMGLAVRPQLFAPEQLTEKITAADLTFIGITDNVSVTIDRPGAWIVSQHTVNAAGQAVSPPSWILDCPGSNPDHPNQSCYDRLAAQGYRQLVSYQPAERFWPFQWTETGIYLVLTLALAALSGRLLRRRLT
jgi:ABC-type transport system involved in multi-copper enzyme maturation permease subunit